MMPSVASGHYSLVVEAIGLPGVGKSTLLHQVVEALRARGYHVTEESYRLGHDVSAHRRRCVKILIALYAMLRHPRHALGSLVWIYGTRQHSWRDFLAVALNWFYINGLVRRQISKPGVHCFDEGIFQACWSVGYRALDPAIIAEAPAALFAIPTIMLVVSVSAEINTVALRLHERPASMSRIEKHAIDPGLLHHAELLLQQTEMLVERLAAEEGEPGRLQLVCIDNGIGHLLTTGRDQIICAISDTIDSNANSTATIPHP